ncbi:hypothetical protein ACP70R_012818 [Stipagrostis hirtigluma subsp. patula]
MNRHLQRRRQRRGEDASPMDGRPRGRYWPAPETSAEPCASMSNEHAATRAAPPFTASRSPPPLQPLAPSI